jgi:tRNA(adenine34) deaminase
MESGKSTSLPCPFEKRHVSALVRDDVFFMTAAFNLAIDAWRADEVPIGAVVELGGEIIGRGHNRVAATGDPTAHAEILAITAASTAIGDWRLNGATLYATKEPCPMCSGATLMARLDRVVYALADPKMGCLGGATNLNEIASLNHHFLITRGVMEEECRALLQAYFRQKRQGGAGTARSEEEADA